MLRKMAILLALIAALPIDAQLYINDTPYFCSVWDVSLQIPKQVEWTLRSREIGKNVREPSWRFAHDLPDYLMSARHSDYNRSGFDRGHMCPAADRSRSRSMMKSTFVLSNVCPQTPACNRGEWKRTEVYCRQAAIRYDSIRIIAVPVFLEGDTVRIGRAGIAVPHAFFKAAWIAGTDSILSAWFMFNR